MAVPVTVSGTVSDTILSIVSRSVLALVIPFLLTSSSSPSNFLGAHGATVCLEFDSILTSTTPFWEVPGDNEGYNTQQVLLAHGHTVLTITNANDFSQWDSALGRCTVIVIPENEFHNDAIAYIG